ncbi:ankyrin repeat-containing protein, putative [Ectocarpus siliculosus]|uniref:Ankyrin repeat-containing protein, putative n=1 Tax=Ectocarpus siliculosus TaxID=2880 RepID=D7FVJ3_ECTSI|nr:ankyrin repeat-containing protein, putative [Ectocarpus siliculosus]|eukprot:CBJ31914.1 ankyrin repeat-containing protein, putative [Ectocarpus siliculosus]
MFSHVLAIDGFPSFFGAQLDRGHCRKLLVSAAVGGSLDILLALLEVGGLLPIVREVGGPHSRPFSALYIAAANGRRSCVKALIEAGAALEYKCLMQGHLGKTALSIAVHKGHEEVVRELLAAGASVSNTRASVMIPEQNLLSVATSRNREGIIDDLVAAGADVGKDREECPPLHVAAKKGFCRPLERLLLAGAKVDCVDRVGRSALHVACFYNREGAVEVLLRHHASTSLLCDEGRSPFDMVAVDALETRQGRAMGRAMGTAMGRAMGGTSRTPCTLNAVETSVADRICGMLRNASKWGRRGWLVMMRARHLDATQVLGTSMSLLSLSTRRWKDGKNESLHDGLATEDTDHDCALGGQCSEQRVPTAPDNPVQAGDAIDGGQARDIRCRGAVVWLLHRPDQSGVFRRPEVKPPVVQLFGRMPQAGNRSIDPLRFLV